MGLGLPLRQPSRFVRIDSRSLTAAHRPARIRAAITSMLRGCRVGVARPHYRPRVAVFSHLQPGDPAVLRSVLCSPFIALLLLVWPSASFAQPQFVNGLRIPGATLDASGEPGANAGRFGHFSDIYYDPNRHEWWALSDRGPGGGLISTMPPVCSASTSTSIRSPVASPTSGSGKRFGSEIASAFCCARRLPSATRSRSTVSIRPSSSGPGAARSDVRSFDVVLMVMFVEGSHELARCPPSARCQTVTLSTSWAAFWMSPATTSGCDM